MTKQRPTELFLPFQQQDQNLPQYLRLFRAFQQAIMSGKLPPGTKLPATRPLCTELKLSRNTIKTAYEMLQAEGYIETRHGAGSYISHQLPDQKPKGQHQQQVTELQANLSEFAQRLQGLANRHPKTKANQLLPAQPCIAHFPWQQWQRHVTAAARQMKHSSLYSDPTGATPLKEQIAQYLQVVRGLKCSAEQIVVCSGSQHAVYLTLRMLLNPGEPILVEDPGYYGIDGAVTATGAVKIPVPADGEGFRLQEGLVQAPNARVALLTPSRNYPMGFTLSLERRLELLQWAKREGCWLIEDDYDSEFRFDGPPLTALQGLGGEHCVIYTGTFSRILHPSIRLGYLVLPPQLIESFTIARRYLDGGLSQLPQLALANFMAAGQFTSHVRRMRKLYMQRRDILNQAVSQYCPTLIPLPADGGMHSTFLLPSGYNDLEICEQAQQLNLGIRPLSRFYASSQPKHGLVIGFAGYNADAIHSGMRALREVLNSVQPVR